MKSIFSFLSFFLLIGNLYAQSSFLDASTVLNAFTRSGINNNYLIQNAGNFENQLTLDTVLKMHKSGINFSEGAYNRVINVRKFWRINDSSRRLIIDILDRSNSELWLRNGEVGAISFVENEYHRKLAIHFIEQYENLPQNLRNLGDDYPAYFLSSEVSGFYKDMNSDAALNLVKKEFPFFPNASNLEEFQNKSGIFWNSVDLRLIENDFQGKMISKIIKNHAQLVEIQKQTYKHPFYIFTNHFDNLGDESSYKVFEQVMDDYLRDQSLDSQRLEQLPSGCNSLLRSL